MNRNKITDKLLYTFGISGILLCLSSLPVLAQQRYPTAATIQKASNQLRQRLGVLSSNGRLRDYRSESEKQTHNNFVAAWNKIDPDVAPFLGQWRGYEASFAIYPSNRKGQVCIMMSSFGWMDIEMGKVSNGNIYTDTGGLFFKEGNYLDLAAPLKSGGLSEGIPLHAPMPLKEPSIDEEIEDRYKAAKVIQAYKQAGCTASLSSNNIASNSSKSELPSQELINLIRRQTIHPNYSDVEYSFFEFDLNNDGNKDAIVYETGTHCGMAMCYFHVFLNIGNQYRLLWGQNGLPTYNSKVAILQDNNSGLFNIAIPRYSLNPFEYDKVKGWRTYKFNGKEYVTNGAVSNSINYRTMIDFEKAQRFNLAVNNTVNRTIRVPDSFQVIIENNGMNTQFVKGKDGYYTWFWKDRPGTCLGLRGNKNPAKVQLATYNCNSRKKARTWEIVMVNNNTGYKVKLPNTSYCLRDNIGIVNCNSSEATVKNLTPQQLEQFTVTPRP